MSSIDDLCKQLGIRHPLDQSTCIGYGQRKPTCDRPVAQSSRQTAATLLSKGRDDLCIGMSPRIQLWVDVAGLLLCKNNHQSQAEDKANSWERSLKYWQPKSRHRVPQAGMVRRPRTSSARSSSLLASSVLPNDVNIRVFSDEDMIKELKRRLESNPHQDFVERMVDFAEGLLQEYGNASPMETDEENDDDSEEDEADSDCYEDDEDIDSDIGSLDALDDPPSSSRSVPVEQLLRQSDTIPHRRAPNRTTQSSPSVSSLPVHSTRTDTRNRHHQSGLPSLGQPAPRNGASTQDRPRLSAAGQSTSPENIRQARITALTPVSTATPSTASTTLTTLLPSSASRSPSPLRQSHLDCIVCTQPYNIVDNGEPDHWECIQCLNRVHNECFDEWRRLSSSSGSVRCMHCRAEVH